MISAMGSTEVRKPMACADARQYIVSRTKKSNLLVKAMDTLEAHKVTKEVEATDPNPKPIGEIRSI